MKAKDYLKKIGITDRVLNREDQPEYWKSISQLMEEYAALCQPPVSGELPISCVNEFEKAEYCSQRNNHLCQKCKDW